MSRLREEVLKHHGLARYSALGKIEFGCVFCYRRLDRCKCTQREVSLQLTMETKSSCNACGLFLVNGEKGCNANTNDLPNREHIISYCRKLEQSGGDTNRSLTRDRIKTSIQLRSDSENVFVQHTESDRLNNQYKTRSRGSQVEPETSTLVQTKRQCKILSEDLLKYHGLVRYQATKSAREYGCVLCFRKVAGCRSVCANSLGRSAVSGIVR